MALTVDQLIYAIRSIESGGNYRAHNPSGAYGAYQVMDFNIPNWTRAALGRAYTVSEFLASPSAQDAVARWKLGSYFKKYGFQGAASMWFSGQPNPNSTRSDGYNTVRQYVDKALKAAGAAPSTYSATSSGGGGTVAKLDDRTMAAMYGLSYDMIKSSSELKKLFRRAVNEGWNGTLFTAHLKNTKWWKTQSGTLRKYITQKYLDPATWKQANAASAAKVNSLAVQVGLGNQITKGNYSKLLQNALYKSRALGWSDERIKDYLGASVGMHDGSMWGEAGEAFDKLHQVAYLNGISHSSAWYASHARSIVSGKSTVETVEAGVRNLAAAKYSAFADQIRAGQNVMDLAAPYIRSVATILELPETDIDLKNKYVSNAMTGAKAGSTYPLWEFENKLRADPLWRKTNNAREGMMTMGRSVLKDFGFAY